MKASGVYVMGKSAQLEGARLANQFQGRRRIEILEETISFVMQIVILFFNK